MTRMPVTGASAKAGRAVVRDLLDRGHRVLNIVPGGIRRAGQCRLVHRTGTGSSRAELDDSQGWTHTTSSRLHHVLSQTRRRAMTWGLACSVPRTAG